MRLSRGNQPEAVSEISATVAQPPVLAMFDGLRSAPLNPTRATGQLPAAPKVTQVRSQERCLPRTCGQGISAWWCPLPGL
jgi:hypothetical protein